MRVIVAVSLVVALVLAGCASPAAVDEGPPDTGEPPRSDRSPQPAGFAEPQDAKIRPGVQVTSASGQCTSNFVFTVPSGDVLLGLAAHCVEGLEIGAPLDIGPGIAKGSLAYSSWLTMEEVGESDADTLEYNDFALILVPPEAHALVSPSMRHFGGPVGLADHATVARGDKVLTYGNSGLRQQVDPASWHEGYVIETRPWTTTIYTATPGVPGDSGSGVLNAKGEALGIVVTLTIAPTVGSNGVTHLDMALAYAKERAGIDATLATWEIDDPGLLPSP